MAGSANWDYEATLKQMVYAYKGYKQCKDQRSALMLCRATPAGKLVNPERCEKEAANFLECYHQTILHSTLNCKIQYDKVFNCLKGGSKSQWGHAAQGVCSKYLDEFSKCQS